MIALALIAIVVLLFIVVFGCLFMRMRFVDLLPLMMMATVGLFLKRWELNLVVFVGDRPFTGLMFLVGLLLVALAIAKFMLLQRGTLADRWFVVFILGFGLVTFLSGLINVGKAPAIVAPFQTLFYTLVPVLLAFLVIDLLPRDSIAFHKLVSSFIVFVGVGLPLLMLSAAIFRGGLIGRFLGWDLPIDPTAGFAVASTPVGSRITSAMLIIPAYGFSLCRYIQTRKAYYIIPLLLSALAVLFSISRSVLVVFIIFHLVFFLRVIWRNIGTVALLCVVGGVLVVVVGSMLPEQYSFGRFFMLGDPSLEIRLSGSKGAWVSALKSPILGQGAGMLYEFARTFFVFLPAGEVGVPEYIVVEGYASPLEPHNTYAFLAAEYGFLGLAIFVGYMIRLWLTTRLRGLKPYLSREAVIYSITFSSIWISFLFGMYTHSIPLINIRAAFIFWLFAFSGLHWYHYSVLPEAEGAIPYDDAPSYSLAVDETE